MTDYCPDANRSWDDPRRWLGIGEALDALDRINDTHRQLHYCVRDLQAERRSLEQEIAAREQQLKYLKADILRWEARIPADFGLRVIGANGVSPGDSGWVDGPRHPRHSRHGKRDPSLLWCCRPPATRTRCSRTTS